MIPKVIHYCWFGPKPFPGIVEKCLRTWESKLPDYELRFWNENNSPMGIPFVCEAYSLKKYAFVSDYVRFWVLYRFGGIYLDTDMFVLKSLNDLLNNKVFFAWETSEEKVLSCGIIGSVPQHPFINEVMKHYELLHFDKTRISDFVIPGIVSKVYRNFEFKEEIKLYPYDYFYPFPYEEKEARQNFMRFKTENTYAIHLWNISWGLMKNKIRDRIFYYLNRQWRRKK